MLPDAPETAKLVGRIWRPGKGPCVVILRDGALIDVTDAVVSWPISWTTIRRAASTP